MSICSVKAAKNEGGRGLILFIDCSIPNSYHDFSKWLHEHLDFSSKPRE